MNSIRRQNPAADVDNAKPYHADYATNSSVFQITPNLQINTEATYSYSRENYSVATAAVISDQYTSYSLRGGFRWQTDYGLIVNDNYFNRTFDNLFALVQSDIMPFTTDLAVSKLEDQFRIGADNTFRVGFEYRNKTFENNGFNNVIPEQAALEENNYAASAAWLWQVNDKLSWTNAGRFDHLDMAETGMLPAGSYFNYADYGHVINTFSGNSGFNYKATDNDTFRLSLPGRGVQEPSMFESGVGETRFCWHAD